MTEKKLDKASREAETRAHVLDEETQAILEAIRHKDQRLRVTAAILFFLLFALGVLGIFYQNKLAQENKAHIDCIIKLSETPLKPGDRAKYIDNFNNTCNIRFTK